MRSAEGSEMEEECGEEAGVSVGGLASLTLHTGRGEGEAGSAMQEGGASGQSTSEHVLDASPMAMRGARKRVRMGDSRTLTCAPGGAEGEEGSDGMVEGMEEEAAGGGEGVAGEMEEVGVDDDDTSISSSPSRDYEAELAELDGAYEEVWGAIRWVHLTPSQLASVEEEGEVPHVVLAAARAQAASMLDKLHLGCHYSVRRLAELRDFADGLPNPSVLDTSWPGFRFGMEVSDIFSREMEPVNEHDAHTVGSDRVYFAGSLWCLDFKRYKQRVEEGAAEGGGDHTEFVAVYLRRRSAKPLVEEAAEAVRRNPASAPLFSHIFEDTRDRTTLAFSIRLAGAPRAPTTNSVCGKSVMGKSFGTEVEQSWGWESYISVASLSDRATWLQGDTLRFIVNLDVL